MKPIKRKEFIKRSALLAGGTFAVPAYIPEMISRSPIERVNVAVVGLSGEREYVRGIIGGRGMTHINAYSQIPNVGVKSICDVDERLFARAITAVETLFGAKPDVVVDFRKLLDDKNIDVISLATPDHWHALMTVWACQAGKDVYVEKPVCHNLSEGRIMVNAARKYNRIVQSGICYRSSKAVREGIKFVHEGRLGKVYMAKGITYDYRDSIGHLPDSPVPDGVNWDLFLGPAPYRPFNENRFTYNWHWFWDTSTTEFGNNGIYRMDTVRWALNKSVHPVKIHCTGGKFLRDDDQEVPNILMATYEYADGIIIQNEVRSLYSNPEGLPDSGNCFVYGDKGWITFSSKGYKTYFGSRNDPGPSKSDDDFPEEEKTDGWKNLIGCVRSRKIKDLDNDILEGHMSAALGHLGIISYRTQHKLNFNPDSETFVNDPEADHLLSREYRKPYVMPERL